ncbi:mycofactocin biosynthesis chaperone MftB [Agromyces archimandritae]|uniref:Mycofactocin biosynthesis chaperone MftB n=1 Tax=Agromyces archimandritae TaxID=2781962 RepID=A0A975FP70_9MICO|nr:mycofactocin biosynthesis chaperone MftB [Agromyces archimandritae]QTX05739.1 mycofactocin biosynthesis chaperone MftB [Agromyces archimandritae]
MPSLDPEAAWQLHPQVSVRPEPFGALLYHFGTRKLSFLKDRVLLDIVEGLSEAATAREACDRAGVAAEHRATYLRALGTLAESHMIQERAA